MKVWFDEYEIIDDVVDGVFEMPSQIIAEKRTITVKYDRDLLIKALIGARLTDHIYSEIGSVRWKYSHIRQHYLEPILKEKKLINTWDDIIMIDFFVVDHRYVLLVQTK